MTKELAYIMSMMAAFVIIMAMDKFITGPKSGLIFNQIMVGTFVAFLVIGVIIGVIRFS